MQTPLPLLIAVLGVTASALVAQDAIPVAAESSAPATAPADTKLAEKKTAAPTAAEEVKKPAPTPTPKPQGRPLKSRRVTFVKSTPTPETEAAPQVEEERPRSFWERLFGRRRKKATPAPATPEPAATPKATPKSIRKPKPGSTPAPESSGTPATTPAPKTTKPKASTTEKPAEKSPEPTASEAAPKPEKSEPAPKATPVPKVVAPKPSPTPRATPVPKHSKTTTDTAPGTAQSRKAPVAPAPDADTDAQEKYRYDVAKEKALQDPEVQKLKEKADGAVSDDEARKAQRAYNKALFGKMRSIDSSIKDRVDRIESSILRRLEEPQ